MLQQGVSPGTPLLCIVRLDTGSPLAHPELVQARLGNAPGAEVAAICAGYENSASLRHLPWTGYSQSLGASIIRDYWLVEAFSARIPLGVVAALASAQGVVRIELDTAKPGDCAPFSDESTVLIGARDAHRLRDASGQPIRGQGVRIAIADSGIDLRTDQPNPAQGGSCPLPPVVSCSVCCWIDPMTGGVDWPHGAFTRGGIGTGGIPNLEPHRIFEALDFWNEIAFYGAPPNTCAQLAPWVSTPEDINWRCGETLGFGFGHGTAVAAIAAGRRYPHTVMGMTQ